MAFQIPVLKDRSEAIRRQTELLVQMALARGQIPQTGAAIAQAAGNVGSAAVDALSQYKQAQQRNQQINNLARLYAGAGASDADVASTASALKMGVVPPERAIRPEVATAAGLPPGTRPSEAKMIEASPQFKGAGNFYNLDQAAYLMTNDRTPQGVAASKAQLQQLYPDGKVPKDYVHTGAASARSEMNIGLRGDQFDQKQWQELNRRTNPNVAPRGSLLGTAGMVNARADRAMQTLNSKGPITNQMLQGVAADIAGILKGGTPDQIAEKQQGYGTLYSDIVNFSQYIKGTPQDAAPKDIVNFLKGRVQELKQVDNKVIKDNLDIAEQDFSDQVQKYPDRWKNHRKMVMQTTSGVTDQSAPAQTPGSTPRGAPVNPDSYLQSLGY